MSKKKIANLSFPKLKGRGFANMLQRDYLPPAGTAETLADILIYEAEALHVFTRTYQTDESAMLLIKDALTDPSLVAQFPIFRDFFAFLHETYVSGLDGNSGLQPLTIEELWAPFVFCLLGTRLPVWEYIENNYSPDTDPEERPASMGSQTGKSMTEVMKSYKRQDVCAELELALATFAWAAKRSIQRTKEKREDYASIRKGTKEITVGIPDNMKPKWRKHIRSRAIGNVEDEYNPGFYLIVREFCRDYFQAMDILLGHVEDLDSTMAIMQSHAGDFRFGLYNRFPTGSQALVRRFVEQDTHTVTEVKDCTGRVFMRVYTPKDYVYIDSGTDPSVIIENVTSGSSMIVTPISNTKDMDNVRIGYADLWALALGNSVTGSNVFAFLDETVSVWQQLREHEEGNRPKARTILANDGTIDKSKLN